MEKNKILVVDDNIKNIQLVLNILKDFDYSFSYALNGKDALELLMNEEFDLILLDVMMPGMDGYNVASELKERGVFTPIIFLTAKSSKDHIVKGFEAGCVDYVVKPFYSKELIARVKVHMELVNLRKELHIKATTDYLTSLPNRREFYEKLEKLYLNKDEMGIAIVDIDYFKKVNDTYGHDAGDFVLKELAKVLTNTAKADLCARIGGEEFALAYRSNNLEDIVNNLEELRIKTKELQIVFNGKVINFTLSIGLAFGSTVSNGIREFLSQADQSLYTSKNKGRDTLTSSHI